MTRTADWSGPESAPRWIMMVTGAYLLLGLFALYAYSSAAPALAMQAPSGGAEGLSVTGMAAAQSWLCLLLFRGFRAGAPLRRAWFLIMLAGVAHVAGGLLDQVSQTTWLLSPLAPSAIVERLHRAALILGGPVQLALLAAGLLAVLLLLGRCGFRVRPKLAGWAVAGILVLFGLYRCAEAAAAGNAISVFRNLLLCVLSVEGLLIWLSAARMGRGLVAKCWRAFAMGIFITGFGEAALWAIGRYFPAWPAAVLEWYVWFPAAAAFALAPAYCVAAVRRATGHMAPSSSGNLGLGAFPRAVPAQ